MVRFKINSLVKIGSETSFTRLVEVPSEQTILKTTLYTSFVGTSGQLSAVTGVRDGVF
jgi:hypothetical protein